jgi:hypothetical protein
MKRLGHIIQQILKSSVIKISKLCGKKDKEKLIFSETLEDFLHKL